VPRHEPHLGSAGQAWHGAKGETSMTEPKGPETWESLSSAMAQKYRLDPHELKEEVQREIRSRLAKQIAEHIILKLPKVGGA
jgi:hypothetical protein